MKKYFQFSNKWSPRALYLWVILLTILYSSLSIIRHNHFQSGGFDLGIYDQSVWQYAHFLSPYSTVKERFVLGDHFALTLPLLAPIFLLFDNVRALLFFQAFWLSVSAIGIYKIANRKLSSFVALVIAFVYSIFYGIQFAVFFDFHPVIIGVGLLPWIAYLLETKRKMLLVVFIAILLLTQENMGIALASLGCCYLFVKEYRKQAFLFIIVGVISSLLLLKITALLSPIGYEYSSQISLNPFTVFADFFNSPEKQQVWFYSLGSFGFLPLLSPGAMLGVLLDLAQYFVTGPGLSRMWSPFMHHRAILAPLLAIGTIQAMMFLKSKRIPSEYVAAALVVFVLLFQYMNHFPLNKLSKAEYWRDEAWMHDNATLLSLVPKDSSVAAPQNLLPHLSHRKEIYLVWPRQKEMSACETKSCWWLDFAGKPEYLVLDKRHEQWVTQILESNEHFQEAIKNMEKAQRIQPVRQVGDAVLYRVNY